MKDGDFNHVSFTSESIPASKLQQLADNDNWLFENAPRLRYAVTDLTKEKGIKIIAGKTRYPATTGADWEDVYVYFGSFFTAGCKPIVTCVTADTEKGHRKFVNVRGLGGELDHRGFIGHVTAHEPPGYPQYIHGSGWLHWIAVGW
jgi:hypothetical protein